MMAEEAPEALENFGLEPFEMKVQGLDRTLGDKVFAICDYYMQDRVKKHSRHIYDIYKLLQIVPQTDEFKALVKRGTECESDDEYLPICTAGCERT